MKRPTKKKRKPPPLGSSKGHPRIVKDIKIEIFVSEFLKHLNGTRAAITAGYSVSTAGVTSAQLLRDPRVKSLLDADRAKYRRKSEVTIETIINELKLIAFARSGDYSFRDHEGNLQVRAEAIDDSELSAAIAEINFTNNTTRKGNKSTHNSHARIRLHDKQAAIDKLGMHLGMWGRDRKISEQDMKEIVIKGGLPDVPYDDPKK